MSSPAYTDADVAFVQGMIHHHRQALEMTAMVPDRTQRVDMRQLTERMDVSQTDEIAQLENWLKDRDEDVPEASAHQHGSGPAASMPGMLTDDELVQLKLSRGADFDTLVPAVHDPTP